jgi:hypothetical protein
MARSIRATIDFRQRTLGKDPNRGTVKDDYLSFGSPVSGMLGETHLPILESGLFRHDLERKLLRALNS